MSMRFFRTLSLGGSLVLLVSACATSERDAKRIPRAESATVASISAQAKNLRAQQPGRPGGELPPKERPSSLPVTALLVDPQQLPVGLDLTVWCRDLARAGMTTLVIVAWTGRDGAGGGEPARQRAGLYFRSVLAPLARDLLVPLVGAARLQGLAVYASVGLRRVDWLDAGLGWTLPAYDPSRQAFLGSDQLDLLHPAYQDFLGGVLRDLAATGIDGIVIRADGTVGPTVGLSPFALKGFERDFGFRPDLKDIVGINGGEGKRSPVYWQWLGWLTREQQHVLDRLANGLTRERPMMKVILEVHPETVVTPVQGLVRHAEDVLEAVRGRYTAFLVSEPASGKDRVSSKLQEVAGGPDRVWVLRPLPWGTVVQTGNPAVSAVREREAHLGAMGVLYVVGSPTLP